MSEIYKSHYTGEEIDEKLASIETLSTEISSMYNRLNTKLINLDDKIDKINTILKIQSESSSEEEPEEGSEEETSSKNTIEKLQDSISNMAEELQSSISNIFNIVNEGPVVYSSNSFTKNGQTYPILTIVDNKAQIDNSSFHCVRYKNIVMLKVKWFNKFDVEVNAKGNVSDVVIFNLHSDFAPCVSTSGFSDGNNNGTAFYSIYSGGDIQLTACGGGARTIPANQESFWLTAVYVAKWPTLEMMTGIAYNYSDTTLD